ncbi:MAG: T9SS type A sorting domain-containing protein [Candidatus Stahlbacteria bacterium]|nr:T9SS type A sorting domain-containing protein [Candidatus Stahlbacteria bacterium]
MFILLNFLWLLNKDNLLLNPSFEEWIDTAGVHRPRYWMTSEFLRPGSAVEDTNAYVGELAIKLYCPDSMAFATTTVPICCDSTYHFKGWAKTSNISAGSFTITWLKIGQQPIDTVTIIPIMYSLNYREYAKEIVAPESANFAVVAIATFPGMGLLADSVTLDGPKLFGTEENSKTTNQKSKLEVYPNPFVVFTKVREQKIEDRIQVYDMMGRLVEETKESIIGKNLPPGFYFVKVKGYKPIKVIKIGI